MTLSIVSPVYNSTNIIFVSEDERYKKLTTLACDFEIILVYDGSSDNSWNEIEKICQQNKVVKGIKLSRNFGLHYVWNAHRRLAGHQ